jgi:hypothetical protein
MPPAPRGRGGGYPSRRPRSFSSLPVFRSVEPELQVSVFSSKSRGSRDRAGSGGRRHSPLAALMAFHAQLQRSRNYSLAPRTKNELVSSYDSVASTEAETQPRCDLDTLPTGRPRRLRRGSRAGLDHHSGCARTQIVAFRSSQSRSNAQARLRYCHYAVRVLRVVTVWVLISIFPHGT